MLAHATGVSGHLPELDQGAIDGANHNDSVFVASTLDDAANRGLLVEIETLWLDGGYDLEVTRQRLAERDRRRSHHWNRKRGSSKPKMDQPIGLRLPVGRTSSSLSNDGQWRRNTDRMSEHRRAPLALAVASLVAAKLIGPTGGLSSCPAYFGHSRISI